MKVLNRKLDTNKTKTDYKKVVWFYNYWGKLTESKATEKVLQLADIQDRQKVLEVACGTGVLFEKIVNQNPNGHTIGIDLTPAMLDKAKKQMVNNKSNFELKTGDVLNLNFEDMCFDRLVNNYMVDLMPEKTFEKIAQEFYRVLKPNGVLAISTFSFGTKGIHKFWFWMAKHFPDVLTGCRPVSFAPYLIDAGFTIEEKIDISQNTFPSEVIKAKKI